MTGGQCFTPPPKLLDQVRDRLRVKHYSIRTEIQYLNWIGRFILFHDKRHYSLQTTMIYTHELQATRTLRCS